MDFFLLILIFCAIGLAFYMLKEAFSNRVIKHNLKFTKLPNSFSGTAIFFISDIHRRTVSKKLINKISGKVDYIIIGGDLAERFVPMRRIEYNLKMLTSVAPVYFVWGNNDYEVDEKKLTFLFKKYNVKSIDNSAVHLKTTAGEEIALLGLKDCQFPHISYWENDKRLDKALAAANNTKFKILISHKPQIITKVTEEQAIQLVLSGHTHGGQIHLLGYSPYEKGSLRDLGYTLFLISNGYGTTGLPLRLGAKSETHLIKLLKDE